MSLIWFHTFQKGRKNLQFSKEDQVVLLLGSRKEWWARTRIWATELNPKLMLKGEPYFLGDHLTVQVNQLCFQLPLLTYVLLCFRPITKRSLSRRKGNPTTPSCRNHQKWNTLWKWPRNRVTYVSLPTFPGAHLRMDPRLAHALAPVCVHPNSIAGSLKNIVVGTGP